ncbi:MAG: hypothetical protein ACK5MK_06620 [Dysgonomonas sp.]
MKQRIFIIIAIFQSVALTAYAQDHLKIKEVFDKYGKQKGSVLVQLSTDILSQGNCRISVYKSLVMDEDAPKTQFATQSIEVDIKKGSKISETNKNGKLELATYTLKVNNKSNEYILYKNKSKKITLVYLKGDFPPQQLDSELNKLKDLFIYVNNKRIKIN